VVHNSVGSKLSHSHERPQFKSRHGHLLILLLICYQIDCYTDEQKWLIDLGQLTINAGAHRSDDQKLLTVPYAERESI
jgi:hypothetical protein